MYTVCEHCQTAFKVLAKQLKAAQGKVRCGHCNRTFNALLSISDAPGGDHPQPQKNFLTLTQSQEVDVEFEDDFGPSRLEQIQKFWQQYVKKMPEKAKKVSNKFRQSVGHWIEQIRNSGNQRWENLTEEDMVNQKLLLDEIPDDEEFDPLMWVEKQHGQKMPQARPNLPPANRAPPAKPASANPTRPVHPQAHPQASTQQSARRQTNPGQLVERRGKSIPNAGNPNQLGSTAHTRAVLSKLVKQQNPFLRAAAVRGLDDQNLLGEVVINDSSVVVRQAALDRIKDFGILHTVAKTDPDLSIREAAKKKLQKRA